MLKSIIGKKIGITQIFDHNGNVTPVTVIEAGPCIISTLRTIEKDGYCAVQLGFIDVAEKNLTKPRIGFFKKNNILPKKILKEFRVDDVSALSIGGEIRVNVFNIDDYVNVSAISKGKGYSGVIKRHNFSMQPVSHGQSDRTRARGSSGSGGVQRVFKGTKMSGHLGCKCVTIRKLRVVSINDEKNVMLVKGAVPSVNGGILFISCNIKKFFTVL
jgi:large subunit ribosomal protein L3